MYGRRRRGRQFNESHTGTLDSVMSGDEVEITSIPDERARVMALRFGMAEGARVSCAVKIPAGPIVLRRGRQEIAVGRGLARRIHCRGAGGGWGRLARGGEGQAGRQ